MIDLIVGGIVLGSILALGAVSLSMVYGVLNFANLAHGDFLALGAYGAVFANIWLGWGIIPSVVLTIIISIVFGLALEKFLWKPLRDKGAGLVSFLIISMGVALALRNSMTAIFGSSHQFFNIPSQPYVDIFGFSAGLYDMMTILVSVLAMITFHYILQRTTLGKSMRALSDSMDLAKVSGINVGRVTTQMWVVVMTFTGLSGALYGIITTVRPLMGFTVLLPIFAATILGGVGSIYGAMLGGLILGISQEVSTIVLPTEYKMAVAFVILVFVLLIRPKGIFGRSV